MSALDAIRRIGREEVDDDDDSSGGDEDYASNSVPSSELIPDSNNYGSGDDSKTGFSDSHSTGHDTTMQVDTEVEGDQQECAGDDGDGSGDEDDVPCGEHDDEDSEDGYECEFGGERAELLHTVYKFIQDWDHSVLTVTSAVSATGCWCWCWCVRY